MSSSRTLTTFLLLCGASLFLCSSISYGVASIFKTTFASDQGLTSSLRIVIELLVYIYIFSRISRRDILRLLAVVGSINSIVVTLQFADRLLESSGFGSLALNSIMSDFWNYTPEFSRFAGLFNSYVSSSYFACLAISAWLASNGAPSEDRNTLKGLVHLLYLSIPIFFGLRTALLLILPLLLYQAYLVLIGSLSSKLWTLRIKRRYLGMAVILASFIRFLFGQASYYFSGSANDFFKSHFEERILPAFSILAGSREYSSSDTLSYYYNLIKIPSQTFFIGNSQHRYSEFGGNDPLFTRWVYQSGLVAGIVAVMCILAILFYLNQHGCTLPTLFLSATLLAFSVKSDTPISLGFICLTLATVNIIRVQHSYSISSPERT